MFVILPLEPSLRDGMRNNQSEYYVESYASSHKSTREVLTMRERFDRVRAKIPLTRHAPLHEKKNVRGRRRHMAFLKTRAEITYSSR